MAHTGALIEPRQARSIATMHRVLDATESLLEESSFESISIQAILRRASVRPGSFYARFPDKLTLLAVLFERYAGDVEAILDDELPALAGRAAEARIAAVIGLVGRTYTTRRGVARSAALHYWNSREDSSLLQRLAPRQAGLMRRLRAVFLAAAAELSDGSSAEAAAFALKMVLMSCREQYLFGHMAKSLGVADEEFASRLTDMVIGYLRGGAT